VYVTYSPGPVQLVHRWSFNESANATVDVDSIGGVNMTLWNTASNTGSGMLALDGTTNANHTNIFTNLDLSLTTNVDWIPTYASSGPGALANLTNATWEWWGIVSNNNGYGRLFDSGADVDSTVTATDTNGITNCYINLVGLEGNGTGVIGASIKPINAHIQYDTPYAEALTSPLTNGTEEYIAMVFNWSAQQGIIYTNGVNANTNIQIQTPPNPISSVNDWSTYLGRSHYVGTGRPSVLYTNGMTAVGVDSVNGGTTDPPMAGAWDELRIWNNALSPAEIASNYAAGPNTIVQPKLTLTKSGNNIVITYPYFATRGSVLASSANAALPLNSVNWPTVANTLVTNQVSGVNSTISVTITPGAGNQYFVLRPAP
jgi:hypothetical protein